MIVGACRSGKTTLGTLLGTCNNVENAEEPWTAKILPLLSGLGSIDELIAKDIFLNFITELCNETILLRSVSFRPDDLSTILNQKNSEEISFRFNELTTRSDVNEFKKKNNPLLLLNLTEVLPFVSFFFDVMPKTKLIHVIRNGNNVAKDCLDKGWFSDVQLKTPIKALPYQTIKLSGEIWHIPWWVNFGDEELFLSYSEYERCIYYWCQNIESGICEIQQLKNKDMYKTIFYEDLITKPSKIFSEVLDYLMISPGPLTKKSLDKIKNRKNKAPKIKNKKISKHLQFRMDEINSYIYNK